MKLLSLVGTVALMLTAPAIAAVDSVEIHENNTPLSKYQNETDKIINVKTSAGDIEIIIHQDSQNGNTIEATVDSHDTAHTDTHADGHKKSSGGLPQLNPKWYTSQIFWLIITFLFMYIPFKLKVLPDLSGVIERRREKIEGDLIAAKDLKQEAEETHALYEQIVVGARTESSALFARADQKIKDLEQETYNEFFQKASKNLKEAEKEVEDATLKAMDNINDVAAETASIAAEKLVGLKADKKKALAAIQSLKDKPNAA